MVILNCKNTLQYYWFYCIFDQRNTPSWANETSYKNINLTDLKLFNRPEHVLFVKNDVVVLNNY